MIQIHFSITAFKYQSGLSDALGGMSEFVRIQTNRMTQRRNIRSISQTFGTRLIPSCIGLLVFSSSLKVGILSKDIPLRLSSNQVWATCRILIDRNIRNRRLLLFERLLRSLLIRESGAIGFEEGFIPRCPGKVGINLSYPQPCVMEVDLVS